MSQTDHPDIPAPWTRAQTSPRAAFPESPLGQHFLASKCFWVAGATQGPRGRTWEQTAQRRGSPEFQAPRPVGRGTWQPPTRQVPSDCEARLGQAHPRPAAPALPTPSPRSSVPEMLMRLTGARRCDEGLCRSPLPGHGGDPHEGTASWAAGPPRLEDCVVSESAPAILCGSRARVQGDPHEGGQEEGNEIATSE